jgi:hypothetical protein
MKTKFFAKTIALGALVWLFFASTQLKAQVANPYMIMNNTPCTVTLRITFHKHVPPPSPTPCAPCLPPIIVVVPPSPPPTMVPVPAGCNCGVMVEVIDVNGTPVNPPIAAGFNVPPLQPHGQGPDPSGCMPSGQIMFDVHPHGTDIHP